MCFIGVLPDNVIYRGSQLRHAWGFEHPNRLGMRFFQLIACYCYSFRNTRSYLKYLIMILAAYFAYKVPNSQTAYIGIMLLMLVIFLGEVHDKYNISKKYLLFIMLITSVLVNLVTVVASFFDPRKNELYSRIDRFLSLRFLYGYKMYNYYGISFWGQKVHTLVEDTKYVGVYRQWYLDNAYLSILLRFGIAVYIVFTILYMLTVIHYVKQKNYVMVSILFTYAVYGIMTTGFYMLSHNIFLLTIADALYNGENYLKHEMNGKKIRIVFSKKLVRG